MEWAGLGLLDWEGGLRRVDLWEPGPRCFSLHTLFTFLRDFCFPYMFFIPFLEILLSLKCSLFLLTMFSLWFLLSSLLNNLLIINCGSLIAFTLYRSLTSFLLIYVEDSLVLVFLYLGFILVFIGFIDLGRFGLLFSLYLVYHLTRGVLLLCIL